jgi:hypothetical protein
MRGHPNRPKQLPGTKDDRWLTPGPLGSIDMTRSLHADLPFTNLIGEW